MDDVVGMSITQRLTERFEDRQRVEAPDAANAKQFSCAKRYEVREVLVLFLN